MMIKATELSMTKRNQILAGILVAQLALIAVVFWPRSAPASANAPLFADLKAADVTALKISDNNQNVIELKKSGSDWVLPAADDFPADASKITPILDKLAAIKTNRLVTRTGDSHKRLQVAADDFLRKVELTLAGGAAHTLFIGSAPGSRATHVRADQQNEVYLASDLASYDVGAQATSWVQPTYVSITPTELIGLTVTNITGTLQFTKDVSGTWSLVGLPAGETLETSAVNSLTSQASSITLLKPVGKQAKPEYGLDAPLATVTAQIKPTDQPVTTLTVTIGVRDASDNSYYIRSSASAFIVKASEYSVRDFVNKTLADFLLKPTPVVTPAS